jgi:2-keto-4-pentenoate hydratase/2-oxohepta-3-ene-1,7-dioic acid hydratase in catechol pathway
VRIARIDSDGAAVTAVVEGELVRPLPGVSVLELLAAEPAERERLVEGAHEELPLAGARLLAPIQPATIRDFSVFEQHGEGATMAVAGPDAKVSPAWYERPAFYFSNPHVVSGPGDPIAAPPGSTLLDLELEVAAVIVGGGANVAAEDAGAHIGGYTIFNDWSSRDIALLEARQPFGFHKAKDFANTLGPWIVTPDELEVFRVGDRLDLDLRAFVNGELLGGDTLANMAWSFEELVAFSSRGSAIAPGDVIASGTCGGGCLFELWGRNQSFEDPPPLRPGDEVRLEVAGIGTLTNAIVAQDAQPPEPPAATPGRRRHRAGTGA